MKFIKLGLLCAIFAAPLAGCTQGNNSGNSFRNAKKILHNEVHNDHRLSFYAGCKYNTSKRVDMASCGLAPRKQPKRAGRIEWEHVMPAWEFGHQMQCWHKSSYINRRGEERSRSARKTCIKTSPSFGRMESDMHNLRPSSGEINGDRSNYRYGTVSGEPRKYGANVDFEVDFKQRVAEPAPSVRGDIARTYFYMEKAYSIRISSKQQRLFRAWDKQDPVDAWELKRMCRIYVIQGNTNPFVGDCTRLLR